MATRRAQWLRTCVDRRRRLRGRRAGGFRVLVRPCARASLDVVRDRCRRGLGRAPRLQRTRPARAAPAACATACRSSILVGTAARAGTSGRRRAGLPAPSAGFRPRSRCVAGRNGPPRPRSSGSEAARALPGPRGGRSLRREVVARWPRRAGRPVTTSLRPQLLLLRRLRRRVESRLFRRSPHRPRRRPEPLFRRSRSRRRPTRSSRPARPRSSRRRVLRLRRAKALRSPRRPPPPRSAPAAARRDETTRGPSRRPHLPSRPRRRRRSRRRLRRPRPSRSATSTSTRRRAPGR